MKPLLAALVFTASLSAHAKREFFVGGFTYHMTDKSNVAERFENKASNDGRLIFNPTIGVAVRNDYEQGLYDRHTFFIGQNSVGREMGGYLYEEGAHFNDFLTGAIVVGGYLQLRRPFVERGILPFRCASVYDGVDLVPVAGIATSYGLSRGVKAHLLLTPVISNLSFSFEF